MGIMPWLVSFLLHLLLNAWENLISCPTEGSARYHIFPDISKKIQPTGNSSTSSIST